MALEAIIQEPQSVQAISAKIARQLFTSGLTVYSMGIRYVDYVGAHDASFRGSTFCECAAGKGSRTGDNGTGSSAIEGKENRRLRDVRIKQYIPRSTRDDLVSFPDPRHETSGDHGKHPMGGVSAWLCDAINIPRIHLNPSVLCMTKFITLTV